MIYDVIIIGFGAAGATAAIYAKRKGLRVLLLSDDLIGSQISKAARVDNWPGDAGISGLALMKKIQAHLQALEIEMAIGSMAEKIVRSGRDFQVSLASGKGFLSKAIIIAVGAAPKILDIKGEKGLIGRGVAYCSICEAPFFKDKQVAVVGGGNAGLMAVLDLAKYVQKVCLFEAGDALTAESALIEEAKKTNKLEIYLNSRLREILGKDKVEAIIFEKDGKNFQQPMAGVFIKIGYKPAVDFLAGFVKLNGKGEIIVHPETLQTSEEGVFAAGDVCSASAFKQAIVAAGQGAAAALSVYKYLGQT